MIYGSICSGIEAATVAWHPLGWQPAFFSEIENFPSAVLAHHYPEVPNFGDFTQIKAQPHAPIDVLVGGTPCQDFSIAGLRAGLDGDRGNLSLEFGRLVQRKRPRWLVWENVPGVLSSHEGRDFGAILGLLAGKRLAVPAGGWGNSGIIPGYRNAYGLAWRVLDAQYIRVDGFGRAVPQRRRRVFVVGYFGDWRRAAAVLFERESLSGNPAPRREPGKGVAGTVAASSGSRGADEGERGSLIAAQAAACLDASFGRLQRCSGQDLLHGHSHLLAFGGNNTSGPIDAATAVRAKGGTGHGDFESETFVAHALRADGFDASEDGTGRGTPLVPCRAPLAFSCKDHGADAGETAPTLRAMGHSGSHANAGGQVAIAFAEAQITSPQNRSTVGADKPCPSLASGGQPVAIAIQERAVCENPLAGPDGAGVRDDGASYTLEARTVPQAVQHGWAVRRLTPRECERLQGFPDDYTLIPRRKGAAPDGPRYKAIGNSMAVNVMRWIGRRIEMVDAIP